MKKKNNTPKYMKIVYVVRGILMMITTIIIIELLLGILGIGIFEFMLKQGLDNFESILTIGIITGGLGMIIGGYDHKLFDE